jgi:CRISPR/Cas system-associated endonuclease/helicase Cas3
MKAGFLRKTKAWTLTDEGEKAQIGSRKTLNYCNQTFHREWDGKRKKKKTIADDIEKLYRRSNSQVQKYLISQYKMRLLMVLELFIVTKNPYEFRDLVAD